MRDWLPVPVWGEGGNRIVGWAKVSRTDYPDVKKYKWWLSDGYVCRSVTTEIGKTTVSMHRYLMKVEPGDPMEVDHVNRDRLDNRRENLRVVDRWTNEGNHDWESDPGTSAKIGVSYDNRLKKWKAQASLDGEYVYLGLYKTEDEAVAARMLWEEQNGRVRKDERERIFGFEATLSQGNRGDSEGVETSGT